MQKSVSYLKGRDRLTVVIGNKSTTIHVDDEIRVSNVLNLIDQYNASKSDKAYIMLEEELFPVVKVLNLAEGMFEWDGKTLKMKGIDKAVPGLLAERILEFIDKNYPLEALINFWKNLQRNPSQRSIEAVYEFIERNGITITNTGYCVFYKGVRVASGNTSNLKAGTAGYYRDKEGKARRPNGSFASRNEIDAYLTNGKVDTSMAKYVDCHSGTFDNSPGLVVSMPREKVDDNGDHGCSFGLHVGAYSYASTFGPVTLKVLVNPEDVVSVPKDCNYQKIRVCKYFVAEVINEEVKEAYTDSDYAHLQTIDLIDSIPYLQHTLFEVDEQD